MPSKPPRGFQAEARAQAPGWSWPKRAGSQEIEGGTDGGGTDSGGGERESSSACEGRRGISSA
eukprot:8301290-Alexandrium_andersonii.AAC.1